MAQTQYQILYRYVNEATNTEITNVSKYNKTEEFYTKDHKLYVNFSYDTRNKVMMNGKQAAKEAEIGNGVSSFNHFFNGVTLNEGETEPVAWTRETASYSDTLQHEAEEERTNIISNAMGDTAKANNLYIYDGTQKIFHKKYIPETVGYKVKGFSALPQKDLPKTPDDYDKPFVMLGGYKPGVDDAYYVCKPEYIKNYGSSFATGSATSQKKMTILTDSFLGDLFPFDFYAPKDNTYVPKFGEQEAGYTDLNSNAFITLKDDNDDSIDYIIVSCEGYYPSYDETAVEACGWDRYGSPSRWHYKYKYNGGIVNKRPYSSVSSQPTNTAYADNNDFYGFFVSNKSNKFPRSYRIATSDFQNMLYADELVYPEGSISDANHTENGDSILQAYMSYCGELVATPESAWIDQGQRYAGPGTCNGTVKYPFVSILTVYKVSELEEFGMDVNQMYDSLTFSTQNITRVIIPEHYEITTENPYMVKDQYVKIEGDPWMLHSVHNSLERGLEMAKKLVKMIGLDNVKLVKTVPTDQKIKIS